MRLPHLVLQVQELLKRDRRQFVADSAIGISGGIADGPSGERASPTCPRFEDARHGSRLLSIAAVLDAMS
ncbi:hypothetical protein MPLDJ20_20072 [Mesorhizobium plurifarium]|uniref:Uncharacterized protein n=1 Tax=Mesorhizobium plurifarium TaxID=69974 RepID=A0A090EUE5_MESPL|nr:hypothetical protein MPLDJ20_20072 [Mesorhizobium plurifarium]